MGFTLRFTSGFGPDEVAVIRPEDFYPKISIHLLRQFGVKRLECPPRSGNYKELEVGLKGRFCLYFFDEEDRDEVEKCFYCEVIE